MLFVIILTSSSTPLLSEKHFCMKFNFYNESLKIILSHQWKNSTTFPHSPCFLSEQNNFLNFLYKIFCIVLAMIWLNPLIENWACVAMHLEEYVYQWIIFQGFDTTISYARYKSFTLCQFKYTVLFGWLKSMLAPNSSRQYCSTFEFNCLHTVPKHKNIIIILYYNNYIIIIM